MTKNPDKFEFLKLESKVEKYDIIDSYLQFRNQYPKFDDFLKKAKKCYKTPIFDEISEIKRRENMTCVLSYISPTVPILNDLRDCLISKKHHIFCQKEYAKALKLGEEVLTVISNQIGSQEIEDLMETREKCLNIREKEIFGLIAEKKVNPEEKGIIRRLQEESSKCILQKYCQKESEIFTKCKIENGECEKLEEGLKECLEAKKFAMDFLYIPKNEEK